MGGPQLTFVLDATQPYTDAKMDDAQSHYILYISTIYPGIR